jgi:O-antigen ligase
MNKSTVSILLSMTARQWLVGCFAGWLFLAVLTPEEVYRTFFHTIIYLLTLYIVFKRQDELPWSDPFLKVFLIFCGYMAVTTWFVGNGPGDRDAQAARWGFEAALGMMAFTLWMPSVAANKLVWRRVFLLVALCGALAALLLMSTDEYVRLSGAGVMENAIQGASIAIVLMAVGLFLLLDERKKVSVTDIGLAFATVLAVCIFVTLTKSRAPIVTLFFYLFLVTLLIGCRARPFVTAVAFLLVLLVSLVFVHWLVDLESLYSQLLARGDSLRLDIWQAYLGHPPESLLIGNGAGLDFKFSDASRLYLEPMGLFISHPHNLWLGVFSETGLIGVLMQAGLVALPAWSVWRSTLNVFSKFHLLGILGLFLMLTFTDEYTLLISLHPIWIIGWIPLVFVWTYSRAASKPIRFDYNGSDMGDM